MPIYEYRCEACGHEMDHFHRTRKDPKPPCEACGEDALERLVSLTSFQLKGDGWYVTDYKKSERSASSGGSASTETSSAEASTTSEKADSTTESTSTTSSSKTESNQDAA